MSDYLKPKVKVGNLRTRQMEDGLFRNPPLYTNFGGFTSADKYNSPTGKRNSVSAMSLESGGPSSQKGKPI